MAELFLKVLTPNIQSEIMMGTFSAEELTRDKQELLTFYGITKDEVYLFDAIVADMMTSKTKFLKHGEESPNLETQEGMKVYVNMMKAAIQYYLYEPFFPEKFLVTLREKNLLYPKLKAWSPEERERLSKKHPIKWEEIQVDC